MSSLARDYLTLPNSRIIPRGSLGGILSPLLRRSSSSSLSVLGRGLLSLPGARLIGLSECNEALSLDGLYRHATAGGSPADGSPQATALRPSTSGTRTG